MRSPSKWPLWKSPRSRRRAQISMKAYLVRHYLDAPGGFVGQQAYCEAFAFFFFFFQIHGCWASFFFPVRIKRSKVALRTRQVNAAPRRTPLQTPRATLPLPPPRRSSTLLLFFPPSFFLFHARSRVRAKVEFVTDGISHPGERTALAGPAETQALTFTTNATVSPQRPLNGKAIHLCEGHRDGGCSMKTERERFNEMRQKKREGGREKDCAMK